MTQDVGVIVHSEERPATLPVESSSMGVVMSCDLSHGVANKVLAAGDSHRRNKARGWERGSAALWNSVMMTSCTV